MKPPAARRSWSWSPQDAARSAASPRRAPGSATPAVDRQAVDQRAIEWRVPGRVTAGRDEAARPVRLGLGPGRPSSWPPPTHRRRAGRVAFAAVDYAGRGPPARHRSDLSLAAGL